MDYKKLYDTLCFKAKAEMREKNNGVYYEVHHIIPLCMGGTGKVNQYKTHKNLVLLTAKEHLIAHRLLHYSYPSNFSLLRAYRAMAQLKRGKRTYFLTSREYEYIREEYAKNLDLNGDKNPFYGKEHNKKTLEVLKNKAIERLSKKENHPMFGKIQTEDSNNKNRSSQKTALKSFVFDLQKKEYILEGTYNQVYNFFRSKGIYFYKGPKETFKKREHTLVDDRYYYCENRRQETTEIKNNVGDKWDRNNPVVAIHESKGTIIFGSVYDATNFIKTSLTCKAPSYQNMVKHLSLDENKKRGWEGYKFYNKK